MNRLPALLAILALAAGCAMTKKEPPPKPFAGTRWDVMLDMPLPGEQPFVIFADGLMEGFGGCNLVKARYVQDTVGARALVVGRIEGGTRGCDARAQAVEARVLGVLQSVSSYTIIADTMNMSGSGGSLLLRAHPEEPKR